MQKKKLNIAGLKVKSFVTDASEHLSGGADDGRSDVCYTIKITRPTPMTHCFDCPVAIDTV